MRSSGRSSGERGALALAALVGVLFALPAAALAAFPGTDPSESPRANTPNDPEFDRCEADDPDTPAGDCTSYFDEQFGLFGFSPDTAQLVPGVGPHPPYVDCPADLTGTPQLDAQGMEANTDADGAAEQCAQIGGIRADTAWKFFGEHDPGGPVGSPEVVIAILDTGIRWEEPELRTKVHLNADELPVPQQSGGADCPEDDCNADGAFNVADFADDPRVSQSAGDTESDSILDASDLIAAFSDGVDDDGNGYVDDIAGWDFFDDDNDPFDASSCCSAEGHGTNRAASAAAQTANGEGGAGICPACQIMPLRVWDTFVVPTDFYAMATVYAADNGASVVEGAVGGLTNTRFARSAFSYADARGVSLMLVSSDINSANHNYPTNYNEAMYVAGAMPDTAPFGTCDGPGGLPGIGDIPVGPPEELEQGCEALLDQLSTFGVNPTAQPTTTSFFRNSNLTQYGGKADIVLMGSTGSENTGQAAGAAGLVHSFGRLWFGPGGGDPGTGPDTLSGNEVRQALTMTAEDVQPENTGAIGQADLAEEGWDTHFGYGRVNLTNALARVANDPPAGFSGWPCGSGESNCVPPEAQLDAPDWFAPINVDRVPEAGIPIEGRAVAPHSDSGVGAWEVEYACGQQPVEADFQPVPGASGTGPATGTLGSLPKSVLEDLAANCDGSVAADPGRPAGTLAEPWPADPYPSPDPERHAFQLRLTVHEADDPDNFGQYRKTLFAYEDDGNLDGWPKPVGTGSDSDKLVTGSGGEQSPRLYDLDGDNELDVLLPTSSGELWALDSEGNPVQSWNGGQPVTTDPYALAGNHPVPGELPVPRETLRTPAIGDVAGDLEPEVVSTAGEHLYAWELDGSRVPGFPVRLDPQLSEPCVAGVPKPCFDAADRAITTENHIKRGFLGSPALADLDGDGKLDIVAGALDQHVYAWSGNGELLPDFPVKLSSPDAVGAEIVTSPAIAQLDGQGPPEVILATNEVASPDPDAPDDPFELLNVLLGQATGANPVYAIHGDGTPVDGWPVEVGVAAGDLLPLVLPAHDAAAVDVDGDGTDEVSVSAATSLAGQGSRLVNGDGTNRATYANAAANTLDNGPILNLADYSSIGDVSGNGDPWVLKGGLTLNGVVNLLAVNQNLPFSHVEQAWDISTGADPAPAAPGYPRATDDFQLLSQAAIARVAGSGPARQALVGTGLYQIHAYGPAGAEAPGWPKFTGGWVQSTSAVGDADGDGDLEVTGYTREGWSFLWDTGVDACGGSNEEWWTWHHDEHSTANYGHDARPPGTPEELTAVPQGEAVDLSWTAPGDDWMCGSADRFRVIGSETPITGPGDGSVIRPQEAAAAGAGETETLHLLASELGSHQYLAVLYRDESGNWGRLASVELPPPAEAVAPGAGEPASGPCANVLKGSAGKDKLRGTPGGDRINGRGGRDRIKGLGGEDCLKGGRGRDRVSGGEGDDEIKVRGGGRDQVRCGPGDDEVVASKRDRVRGCEKVRR